MTGDVDLDSVLEEFGSVWSDHYLLDEIATALNCREADALASLLRELGQPVAAGALMLSHSEGDDEGDDHYRGDA